jgi:hypothetical protein
MPFSVKDLKAFMETMPTPIASVLLRADHGKGKSSLVDEFAEERKLRMVEVRLGQIEVGDMLGLPQIVDGLTVYATPKILEPIFNEPCVLFFDELNRGAKDVQQAVFEIILDRTYRGRTIHPGTFIFSAINSNMDIYTVTEIDPALLTRFIVVDFEPTVKEWLDWGKKTGNLEPEIISYCDTHKNSVDPPKVENGDYSQLMDPHTNRRSWAQFSKWLKIYREHEKFSQELIRTVCAGFIGNDVAPGFVSYLVGINWLEKEHDETLKRGEEATQNLFKDFDKDKLDVFIQKSGVYAAQFSKWSEEEKTLIVEKISERIDKTKLFSSSLNDKLVSLYHIFDEETFKSLMSRVSWKYKYNMEKYYDEQKKKGINGNQLGINQSNPNPTPAPGSTAGVGGCNTTSMAQDLTDMLEKLNKIAVNKP